MKDNKDTETGRRGDAAKLPSDPPEPSKASIIDPLSEDSRVTEALKIKPETVLGDAANNFPPKPATSTMGGGTSAGSPMADAAVGAPPPVDRRMNSSLRGAPPTDPPPSGIFVEVICEGVLGPKLLRKGQVTDDPAYVKLLGDRRNLVRKI